MSVESLLETRRRRVEAKTGVDERRLLDEAMKIATNTNNELSRIARHLLIVLASLPADDSQCVSASQKTLAGMMACSSRSVRRALFELQEGHYIFRYYNYNGFGQRWPDVIELQIGAWWEKYPSGRAYFPTLRKR